MNKRTLYISIAAVLGIGVIWFASKSLLFSGLGEMATTTTPTSTVAAATSTSSEPSSVPVQKPDLPKPDHSKEVVMQAYLTAYTYWDNTPPGSSIIAFAKSDGFPTLHNVAGGSGTFADPITIAVGHTIMGGEDTPDFAPGTRFYMPHLRKYFMVEDTCGDGNRPQDIPCHHLTREAVATGATVWLDMWVGGEGASESFATECAESVTGGFKVIKNPLSIYVVNPGPVIGAGTCAEQYADSAKEL